MLTEKLKEKLKANWGDKADALACYAEARLYDPLSTWQFFLLSMNPENEDEVFGIHHPAQSLFPMTIHWTMSELASVYNEEGEGLSLDGEFRRRIAAQIFKKLYEGAQWTLNE